MLSRFNRSGGRWVESLKHRGWAGPNALQAVLLACLLVPTSCRAAVLTWTRWEQPLTSTVAYTNPGTVTLKVSYAGPNQRTMNGLGFWDGSNSFRIRCLFPEPGHWTWQTTCSDSSNAGLHNRSGSVEVTPYSGSNPLYRHGLLRVADNHRFLAHADSTPFLWIGDTPWTAPMNASLEDWQTYLRDRRDKGFTILQVFCASDWAGSKDVEGNAPFLDAGLTHPNPAYWQEYDQKVQMANEQGLLVLIVGLMEPVKRYPDPASAQQFARYLVARMTGNFVIFSPSFDSPYRDLGDAVGRTIRECVPLHLITQHPQAVADSQRYYDQPYLDFCGVQTGAGWGTKPLGADIAARNAVDCCLALYNHHPPKPVVNMEARYDSEFNEKQMPRLPRSCGYWAFLSGCAGYTYGCAGLFNWGLTSTHNDPQATLWDWRSAMNRPSSTEMKHLADFFRGLEWWRLEPHHDVILNQADDPTKRMVLAKSAAGDLAVAYLPDNPAITIEMSSFPAPMRWRWFNPATGEAQGSQDSTDRPGQKTFQRPSDWEDALLVLVQVAKR
ncbi:MAG TPA: DUF4038 domain-containing protein [Verrucomicrobiae bacterium]